MENNSIHIIPTCVPLTKDDVENAVSIISGFTDTLHIDCSDGVFAEPRTWPSLSDESIELPKIVSHVHLMVEDTKTYGDMFALAGAHTIIVHAESFGVLELLPDLIKTWKKHGVLEVGVAFLLKSDVSQLLRHEAMQSVDFALCMSVEHIGAQGAQFKSQVMEHIREIAEAMPGVLIAVDGGITNENIADLVIAGATRFYVGSAIMKASDPQSAYNSLVHTAKSALQ
ncbi:MAG: ribulose-phosphate 3-epimerase, ribulose-phosphate 3-epimerase [Candidatus Kaiserbacteria bacterium]|nr:ribulose-phosphate 3-epimerase, ribulose-phosphate 3-epimerase [Candidatus Kaiserbacteria bacterium]